MLFWGAGFSIVFLIAFLLSFIQYRIIKPTAAEIKTHTPDNPVACGTAVEIRYECRGFPLMPGCSVSLGIDFRWHERVIKGCSLYASGSQHGIIRINALQRGEYQSTGAFFTVTDAAGFFHFRMASVQEQQLIVEPVPVDNIKMPRIMSSGGDDTSRTLKKKRSDNLIETRQYYPGDDVRRINWKAFAHLGELFIRLGEEMPDPNAHLMIIPDFSGQAGDYLNEEQRGRYLDYLVAVLSGIIDHLAGAGVSIEILSPAGTLKNMAGLWWNEDSAALRLNSSRKCSCLLISSAFSEHALSYCSRALENGMPVNAVIPVPELSDAEPVPGVFSRLLFTGIQGPVENDYSNVLQPVAEALAAELSLRKGVVSADII